MYWVFYRLSVISAWRKMNSIVKQKSQNFYWRVSTVRTGLTYAVCKNSSKLKSVTKRSAMKSCKICKKI